MNKPATKNRQRLASHNQPAAPSRGGNLVGDDEAREKFERLCTEQEGLYRAEFEQAFAALFAADERQRAIYKTAFWNIAEEIPANPDSNKIAEALNNAGFAGNEAYCRDFYRYCEIVLEGKRLQQGWQLSHLAEVVSPAAADEPPQPQQGEGWRFVNFDFIAPQELQQAIASELDRQAVKGVGLWLNETEPSGDDVGLDEFMCVEAYNVQCSNQPFYSDLIRFGITPSLLDQKATRLLFALLKSMGDKIKSNTTQPHKVKSQIVERLRGLDDVPIWGLLYQILLLQGLSKMLECCTLAEGDTGYQDAVLFYEWLQKRLSEKLICFIHKPWGVADRERLKPLTEYLYTTEVGRLVQGVVFGVAAAQPQQGNQPPASQEPSTERAKKAFEKALEADYMKKTSTGYKWQYNNGSKASLGYFLIMVYNPDNTKVTPFTALEALFGVTRLDRAAEQATSTKKPQQWRGAIDELLKNL